MTLLNVVYKAVLGTHKYVVAGASRTNSVEKMYYGKTPSKQVPAGVPVKISMLGASTKRKPNNWY
jgi:hypothetical protein